ncbi:MAG: response regulator transcription factor [Segetibacter sp.]|nr:response regulator transcription factor [Segetibacter sp.]
MSTDIVGSLWSKLRMLILIVDSSILIIERLEEIISEAENITAIHKAVSSEEAKKLLKENKYDTVILDIDLPGNEALKLLKEIKKTSRKTCVIILFTQIDNYIQEQCKSLGADFFFDKYYEFEKIYGLLCNVLCGEGETECFISK